MRRKEGGVQCPGTYLGDRLVVETVPLSVGERPAVTERTLKLNITIYGLNITSHMTINVIIT